MTAPASPFLVGAADHYWSTLLRQDGDAAYEVVARIIDDGVPVADALSGIVVHVQQLIGDSWAANQWTVGQEHAATAISEEVVQRILADLPAPDPSKRPLIVSCAEREFHSLAALVVTTSLRSWDWPAEFAGPDTRPDVLQLRIAELQPAAVLISASLSSSLTRVARQIAVVARTGVPVIAGGAAFDVGGVRATRLGASAYAATPAQALEILDRLPDLMRPQPVFVTDEVARLEQVADRMAREVLESTVSRLDATTDALSPDHWQVVLATFTPHLVAAIAGGILTADPTVPASARDWLAGVLARRGAPDDVTDVLWEQLRQRLADFPASRVILA